MKNIKRMLCMALACMICLQAYPQSRAEGDVQTVEAVQSEKTAEAPAEAPAEDPADENQAE